MSRRPGNPYRRFGDSGGGLFSKSRSPPVLSIALVVVVRVFFFFMLIQCCDFTLRKILLIDLVLATLY